MGGDGTSTHPPQGLADNAIYGGNKKWAPGAARRAQGVAVRTQLPRPAATYLPHSMKRVVIPERKRPLNVLVKVGRLGFTAA